MTEKKFLAKSYLDETIQEHTDNVVWEYERLKRIYSNCNVNWALLEQACLYHDLGKMNSKFQRKIQNGEKVKDEIPHGVLSTLFLDVKKLKNHFKQFDDFRKYNDLNDAMKLLFSAIYYHHDRDILANSEFQKNLLFSLNEEIVRMETHGLGMTLTILFIV